MRSSQSYSLRACITVQKRLLNQKAQRRLAVCRWVPLVFRWNILNVCPQKINNFWYPIKMACNWPRYARRISFCFNGNEAQIMSEKVRDRDKSQKGTTGAQRSLRGATDQRKFQSQHKNTFFAFTENENHLEMAQRQPRRHQITARVKVEGQTTAI